MAEFTEAMVMKQIENSMASGSGDAINISPYYLRLIELKELDETEYHNILSVVMDISKHFNKVGVRMGVVGAFELIGKLSDVITTRDYEKYCLINGKISEIGGAI